MLRLVQREGCYWVDKVLLLSTANTAGGSPATSVDQRSCDGRRQLQPVAPRSCGWWFVISPVPGTSQELGQGLLSFIPVHLFLRARKFTLHSIWRGLLLLEVVWRRCDQAVASVLFGKCVARNDTTLRYSMNIFAKRREEKQSAGSCWDTDIHGLYTTILWHSLIH